KSGRIGQLWLPFIRGQTAGVVDAQGVAHHQPRHRQLRLVYRRPDDCAQYVLLPVAVEEFGFDEAHGGYAAKDEGPPRANEEARQERSAHGRIATRADLAHERRQSTHGLPAAYIATALLLCRL